MWWCSRPQANPTPIHVRLKGLREDACYQELIFGKTYSGGGADARRVHPPDHERRLSVADISL